MFSKEEAKQLRIDFWNQFQQHSQKRRRKMGKPGKWTLDRTGINALNLRFHFDRDTALVGIDIETASMDKRLELYEKLETLKKQVNKALGENTKWELDYTRENNKNISRIYTFLTDVDIFNKDSWNRVNMFFFDRMLALEEFYDEYRDYLKY